MRWVTYIDSSLNARLHACALKRDIHTPLPPDGLANVHCGLLRCGELIFNRLWAFRLRDGCIPLCSKAFVDSKVNAPLVDIRDDNTRSSRELRHRSNEKANGSSADNEHSGSGREGAIAEGTAGCMNGDGERLDEGGGSVGDAWGEPAGKSEIVKHL